MKVLKRILIIIGIIILIIAGIIAYAVINDLKQEEILEKELLIISNKDLIKDDYIVDIKTKGEYAYVEEAIKKYYKELSENVKELNSSMDNDEFTNIISADNLQKDKNGFIKSRKIISTTKEKITNSINNISKLCSEDYIKNLIDKEKVSDYTIEFYKKIMYTKKDIEELNDIKEKLQKTSTDFNKFLDKIVEILDMLDKNNDSWLIKDNQLYFTNSSLVDEYNKLYKELSVMAEEDFNVKTNEKKESSTI